MMYLTLFSIVSVMVPFSRMNNVVTFPKATAVRAIWFKKRCAKPSSKLIRRLDMESMIRLPPALSCTL